MLRTRDFLLFLIMAAFLVVVIGVQSILSWRSYIESRLTNPFVREADIPVSFSAYVEMTPDTRATKLAELRLALATQEQTISAPTPVAPEPVVATSTTAETISSSTPKTPAILLCKKYTPTFVPWTTDSIFNEEREGVRVFYSISNPAVPSGGSSTSPVTPSEVVHAVLPIRTLSLATPNCIPGDVVGIALDGSLIHNTEQKLYSIFGDTTIIGYALDGFPIYGISKKLTDRCGGTMVDGSYRYYLASTRDGVLGCYSGIPAKI